MSDHAASLVFVGFLLVVPAVFMKLGNEKQGPYDLEVKSMSGCTSEGEQTLIKIYMKSSRANRTTMLAGGRVILNRTFDDNFKGMPAVLKSHGEGSRFFASELKLYVDQKTSQGWKENFFFTDFKGKGACSVFTDMAPSDAKRLFSSLKLPGIDSCPIETGIYDVEPMALEINTFKGIPIFFYNTYRARLNFHHPDLNSPPVGCITAIIDIVPKRRKG